MSRIYTKKKRNTGGVPLAGEATRDSVSRQLAWASSSQQFKSRDPLFHITDNFMKSFDAMGSLQTEKLTGAMKEETPGLESREKKKAEKDTGSGEKAPGIKEEGSLDEGGTAEAKSLYAQTRMNGDMEAEGLYDSDKFSRFSEMGFMRGKLSASVINGTGEMTLFSCLKRTIGQSQPLKRQQRKLFLSSARNWKPQKAGEADASRTVFSRNETFADSAIGLTVDTTRDARRTVDMISDMIVGGERGTETWEKMAPFLATDKDQQLLDSYNSQLKNLSNDEESVRQKKILEKAVTRTETMLAKKKQLKEEFVFKIRAISQQAAKAEQLFTEMLSAPEVKENLQGPVTYPEPPEGNPPPADEMPGSGTETGSGKGAIPDGGAVGASVTAAASGKGEFT